MKNVSASSVYRDYYAGGSWDPVYRGHSVDTYGQPSKFYGDYRTHGPRGDMYVYDDDVYTDSVISG